MKITPDITVRLREKFSIKGAVKDYFSKSKLIAFELENDYHWDFQESLRQVKKYKRKYPDTRVIIPDTFKRFAPLYRHEGFRVYLWSAKRLWQCLRCEKEAIKEGPLAPKCSNCNNNSQSDFKLIGLKDAAIEEFT